MTTHEVDRGNDPATYGDAFADVYDAWYGDVSDVAATVEALTSAARGGAVLELGVGTGRLALPLARRGVAVTGVDASAAMLEQLAANDPSNSVVAVLANMADLDFHDEFAVAFVAFNTFFNLMTEADQRRCFAGVAMALHPGGTFFVEAIVPDMTNDSSSTDRGVDHRFLDDGGIVLNATIRDRASQVVKGQHIEFSPTGKITLRPWQIRYCSIAQLDEMAGTAGFSPITRWGDWSGSEYDDGSSRHVTSYQLP